MQLHPIVMFQLINQSGREKSVSSEKTLIEREEKFGRQVAN